MGDVAYTASVLMYSVDKVFILRTLPWLLGSGWSIIFELIVSCIPYRTGFNHAVLYCIFQLVAQIIGYRCQDYHEPSKELSKELAILMRETTV